MEGDASFFVVAVNDLYFYPRPPGGGRLEQDRNISNVATDFYPRPPGGGRPAVEITPRWRALYFYPRPPGGGRRYYQTDGAKKGRISIHALRVEGDDFCVKVLLLI